VAIPRLKIVIYKKCVMPLCIKITYYKSDIGNQFFPGIRYGGILFAPDEGEMTIIPP